MEYAKVSKVEKWIYYFMGGFALSSSLSIATTNIFLSLAIVAALWRLWLKHDDLKEVLGACKGITMVFALFLGATLISGLASSDPLWSLRLFGDYYVYRMLGLYIVLLCIRDKGRLLRLMLLTAASVTINNAYGCLIGLLPVNFFATIGFSQKMLGDITGQISNNRVGGVLGYMVHAGLLSAAIPVFFVASVYLKNSRQKLGAVAMLLIGLLALSYNGTRGAWIAIGVTLPMVSFMIIKNKKIWLAGCMSVVLLLAGCYAVSPQLQKYSATFNQMDYQSNSERLLIWQSSLQMFQDHPVAGVGFGQFEQAYQTQYISPQAKEPTLGHAHSNIMQMIGERGFIGVVSFIIWWFYIVAFGIQGWRKEKNIAYVFLVAMFMGVMLQGLTEYNMGTTVVTKFFWFVLGLNLQWIIQTRKAK